MNISYEKRERRGQATDRCFYAPERLSKAALLRRYVGSLDRGGGLYTFGPSGLFQTFDDMGHFPLDAYFSIGLYCALRLISTARKSLNHQKLGRA